MTIKITGYPGEYRRVHGVLRTFLMLQLDIPGEVVDQLDTWAAVREGTGEKPRTFATWLEAATAAEHVLTDAPMRLGTPRREDVAAMAVSAAAIARSLMTLTGSWQSEEIEKQQVRIAEAAQQLVKSARSVSAGYRARLTTGDIDGLIKAGGGGSLTLHAWQKPIALTLMRDPCLTLVRPAIRVAVGSEELTESLLVKLKKETRVSASAKLSATVGAAQIPVKATFTTNSGRDEQIEFRYSYPNPRVKDETIDEIERLRHGGTDDARLAEVYQSFAVTADPSEKDATSRAHDAEKKIFDALHDLLVRVCRHLDLGTHEVIGTVEIVTGIRMCASCYMVALQFATNFPNLRVVIRRQLPTTTTTTS